MFEIGDDQMLGRGHVVNVEGEGVHQPASTN